MKKKKLQKTLYCDEHKMYYDTSLHKDAECPECYKERKPCILTTIFKVIFGILAITGLTQILGDIPTFLGAMLGFFAMVWAIFPHVQFAYKEMNSKDKKLFPTMILGLSSFILFILLMVVSIEAEQALHRERNMNDILITKINQLENQQPTKEIKDVDTQSQIVRINDEELYGCEETCLRNFEYEHGIRAMGVNGIMKHDCFKDCYNNNKVYIQD